jgi:hypothetical protein
VSYLGLLNPVERGGPSAGESALREQGVTPAADRPGWNFCDIPPYHDEVKDERRQSLLTV